MPCHDYRPTFFLPFQVTITDFDFIVAGKDSFLKKNVSKKDETFKRWDVSQTHLDSSQALGSLHGGLPTDFPLA